MAALPDHSCTDSWMMARIRECLYQGNILATRLYSGDMSPIFIFVNDLDQIDVTVHVCHCVLAWLNMAEPMAG